MLTEWIDKNCLSRTNRSLINHTRFLSWWENRNFINERNKIIEFTKSIDTDNFTIRLYHAYKDDCGVGKCEVCGNDTEFLNFKYGYRIVCSVYCSGISPTRLAKIKKNSDYTKTSEKIKQTNLERYGVTTRLVNSEYQAFLMESKVKKYGTMKNALNNEKNKKTCLERYGVEYYYQSKDFKDKSLKTRIERYGQSTPDHVYNYSSKGELELLEFLNSFGYEFKKNRKLLKTLEIDCYCEELNLGIEYCGLYYHSEVFRDTNYHYNKMKACEDNNTRLITIFEDEWLYRKEQVKQYLASVIGKFENRIYARDTKFVELEKTNISFFDNNHIQGNPNRVDRLFGLMYNNETIGAISYGFHHRGGEVMTLNRLAFKDNIQCVGGASKLIKNSLKHFDEVLTWSDSRWTPGTLYQNCGFNFDGELRPDYSYINQQRRVSKQSMQKKKIGCPPDKTEHEFCLEKKIFRIYDCGKKRWIYKKELNNGN